MEQDPYAVGRPQLIHVIEQLRHQDDIPDDGQLTLLAAAGLSAKMAAAAHDLG
jgi:hypothetical protein